MTGGGRQTAGSIAAHGVPLLFDLALAPEEGTRYINLFDDRGEPFQTYELTLGLQVVVEHRERGGFPWKFTESIWAPR